MKALERHRQTWQGKSDEWIFERLDNELKQKIKEIHRLLTENDGLRQFDVSKPRELLIAFKTWEVDNDIKNLLPDQLADFYLEESN